MKISQLKDLCEQIELSKTGKKTDIITRLMNCKIVYDNDDDNDDNSSYNFQSDDEN
jgi:hypothetical protein